MARTYRKVVRVGVCCGTNTEFYRDRRHTFRRRCKNYLRTLMANTHLDEVDDKMCMPQMVDHDSWCEPTDGTWIVNRSTLDTAFERNPNLKRRISRLLKPKYAA